MEPARKAWVQEYGDTEAFLDYENHVAIYYPVGEILTPDKEVRKWTLDYQKKTGTLINYDSYISFNRYAGVLLYGDSVTKTFNIDLMSGKVMDIHDIFKDPDGFLSFIESKYNKQPKREWLKSCLITPQGFSVFAPELDQEVFFSYEEIWDFLALKTDIEIVKSSFFQENQDETIGICFAQDVVVRTKDTVRSKRLGTIDFGTRLNVLERNVSYGWHKILYRGTEAYITADYIKFDSDEILNQASDPNIVKSLPPIPEPIDPNKPMIALTFDDGPSNTTAKILDVIEEYGGRVTFCMVGNRVESREDIVARAKELNCEIASHTWEHRMLAGLNQRDIREELNKTRDIIMGAGGGEISILRPPFGRVDESVKTVAKEMNMSIANWCVDTLDWKTQNPSSIYKATIGKVKDGDIVLYHDLFSATGEAMKEVIPELLKEFQLVTVSELLSFCEGGAVPGEVYRCRK